MLFIDAGAWNLSPVAAGDPLTYQVNQVMVLQLVAGNESLCK